MKSEKLKRGGLVEVEFWDHCKEPKGEKFKGLMRFKIWGRIERVTKQQIVLRQWELQTGCEDTKEFNNELARVSRPSIIEVRELGWLPSSSPKLN